MKRQKGFTLVETLVALAIFGIIGVILLGGLDTSITSTMINNKVSKAQALARDQLEYIQSQTWGNPGDYSVLSIPSNSNGFSYASPMVTTVESGLQKITVTVNNDTYSFTLVGYKVNR